MAETLISPKEHYGAISATKWGGLTDNWVVSRQSADEAVYVDTLSPVTAQTSVRIGSTPINNIYSNVKVSADNQYWNKRGRSILLQDNEFYRVTGTVDGVDKYVPWPVWVVSKVPELDGSLISDTEIAQRLERVITLVRRYPTTPVEGYTPIISETAGIALVRRGINNF